MVFSHTFTHIVEPHTQTNPFVNKMLSTRVSRLQQWQHVQRQESLVDGKMNAALEMLGPCPNEFGSCPVSKALNGQV